MKTWIGKFMIGIGLLHTLFGVGMILPLVGSDLLAEGILNTINGQPKREAFLWFLIAGFLLIILGALMDNMEKRAIELPAFLGWSLLIMTIFILILSPLNGGWLLLIPSIAILLKARNLS